MRDRAMNSIGEASPHPRPLGWVSTTALAMGGSNQALFLLSALFIGQAAIPGQGSAAVPLLILGLLLSWAAAPAWTELVLMSKDRVGGIASACTVAFRPYSSVLSALTGVCYWWGWVPTCGLTALLSASAIHHWMLPGMPIPAIACSLVLFFTAINLAGLKWVRRLAVPIGITSAILAFLSILIPIFAGQVDWQRATDFSLTTPFSGWFGQLTSVMAGLYLIGFAAPAFEAATCHVGETRDPEKNVPRAVLASGGMAALFFIAAPLIWLGTLGPEPMGQDLAISLGPIYAPLFGGAAKAVAIGFMMFNMFHGTIQPLAGASRTLSQLSEDGLLPRFLAIRSSTDCPWVATVLTAAVSIAFLLIGDPIWLIAAANFTYLIGICMPNVAALLLRRDAPDVERPYRAPKGFIALGVAASGVWLMSAVLGFQQFGLPTVLFGLAMAYSGAGLYAWRIIEDRLAQGKPAFAPSLHVTLTGAMLLVLVLDGAGYLVAVQSLHNTDAALIALLEDVFVAVAMLTLAVGLVLPGVIAHAAGEISSRAQSLTVGPLREFSAAMGALGRGDLDAAHAKVEIEPMWVRSADELGQMALSFNQLQIEMAKAATGLNGAREGLLASRALVTSANEELVDKVRESQILNQQLLLAKEGAEAANLAKSEFLAVMSHEIRTPLNGVLGMAHVMDRGDLSDAQREHLDVIRQSGEALLAILNDVLDLSKIEAGKLVLESRPFDLEGLALGAHAAFTEGANSKGLSFNLKVEPAARGTYLGDSSRIRQILYNLISNAVKFTAQGEVRVSIDRQGEHVVFRVSDTGVGIAPDQISGVFDRFVQADSSTTRQFGGSGLGLAITRDLCTAMGGSIGVTSELGRGSRFEVRLPLEVATGAAAVPSTTPDDGGAVDPIGTFRILAAEDNSINQLVLKTLLAQFDLSATFVENGQEAVASWRAAEWDLVLMDIQMPVLDGPSAVRQIRELEAVSGRARVPIVALTANAMVHQIDPYFEAGMNDIIAKPIEVHELLRVIQAVANAESYESAVVALKGSRVA